MSSKNEIIKILEVNKGNPVGGAEIGRELNISRNAVWKAIKELKEEGFDIISEKGRGYTLLPESDVISEEGISLAIDKQGLKEAGKAHIEVYKAVTSTNTLAKERAAAGCPDGTVITAEEQTAGKGRLGRSFVSPSGGGIYLSVVLRRGILAENCVLITTAASVAVMRAIKKATGKQTLIKWVNDLYLDGKKVCGILTEAVTDFESGNVEYIVLGIGINFSSDIPSLAPELRDKAGALFEKGKPNVTRNEVIAQIIEEIFALCKEPDGKKFIDEYREHSLIIGDDIFVIRGGDKKAARALGIDESGGLIVRYEESGEEAVISSGEVSIRKRLQ